jgi:hypothetical protein
MKDWKAIAKASGIGIPDKDLDRVTAPLEALEEVFRPLANTLTPDVEPATEFRVEEDQ